MEILLAKKELLNLLNYLHSCEEAISTLESYCLRVGTRNTDLRKSLDKIANQIQSATDLVLKLLAEFNKE